MNIYLIKDFFEKKSLVGKLVLACEYETLKTTESLHDDKKVTREKYNCLINTVLLLIICLFILAVISVSCYHYYSGYWIKKTLYRINIKWIV